MGTHAISQTVTTEFVEIELGESLLTEEEEQELLGLLKKTVAPDLENPKTERPSLDVKVAD